MEIPSFRIFFKTLSWNLFSGFVTYIVPIISCDLKKKIVIKCSLESSDNFNHEIENTGFKED